MSLVNHKKIRSKIEEIKSVEDLIPSVIIIHDLPHFNVLYMSKLGLKLLNQIWDEIKGMSGQEYHKRFFNEVYAREYVPKILELLERNTDEFISYFQQVKTSPERKWDWYMSITRILARSDENQPIALITTSMQIDPQHYFTAKAVRLLEENSFLKKHYHEFSSLTTREREILRLLSLGKTTGEMATELFISAATVETHRKNVKRKLKITSAYDLSLYARSFDLI